MKSFQKASDQQRKDRKLIMEGEVNKRVKTEIVRVRKLLRQGIGLNDITTFLDKTKYFSVKPGDASPRSQRAQPEPAAAIKYRREQGIPEPAIIKPAKHRTTGAVARAEALAARAGHGPIGKHPNPHASAIMGTIHEAKPTFLGGVSNPMAEYGQKPSFKLPQQGTKFIGGQVFDK